jgi:hypothetical protein
MNIQEQLTLSTTRSSVLSQFVMLRIMPVVAIALTVAVCASTPANAESSTPARVAQVRHACADTMGLNPAEEPFDGCVASLLDTLAETDQARLTGHYRQACVQHGLQPGTPEFALCVVDAEQTGNWQFEHMEMRMLRTLPLTTLLLLAAACASPSPNQVQLTQERHTCAELGIAPGSGSFASCVGNLEATAFEANDSAMRWVNWVLDKQLRPDRSWRPGRDCNLMTSGRSRTDSIFLSDRNELFCWLDRSDL